MSDHPPSYYAASANDGARHPQLVGEIDADVCVVGGGDSGSEMLHHAAGGLLDTMPDAMAVFAPNINSYRRFAPDTYVPVGRAWGVNNRSVAVRVPGGDDENRRLEHRVAGADANPYRALDVLAASAVMADCLGEKYVRAYVECKRGEMEKFMSRASPLEYAWYLRADG